MKHFFSLCFLTIGLACQAQVNLDSLLAVWQDETQPDSVRAFAYKDYLWNGYMFSQPDSAFVLADNLLEFAEQHDSKVAEIYGLQSKGSSRHLTGKMAEAVLYYNEALKRYELLGDLKGQAMILNNLGLVFLRQGNNQMSLKHHLRSKAIREQIGDSSGLGSSLLNIGVVYREQENNERALEYFEEGLKICEAIGHKRGLSNALSNIANIYHDQERFAEAHEFLERSKEIYLEINDKRGLALYYTNSAAVYRSENNFEKALEQGKQSLAISREIDDQHSVLASMHLLGMTYLKNGDLKNALDYCEQGLETGQTVMELAAQVRSCDCLYQTHKQAGRLEEALTFLELGNTLRDSLQIDETNRSLERMEFEKQVLKDSIGNAEKARLIEEVHQQEVRQKNRTRNIFGVVGMIALILAGGIYSRLRYTRQSKAVLQVEKDRSENLLLNILPEETAKELKEKGHSDALFIDSVTVLFTDFKGFTALSEQVTPKELVADLHECFSQFDRICEKYGIEKIKTIGDAYMAAGGLPTPNQSHAQDVVKAALEMAKVVEKGKARKQSAGEPFFEIRIGVHTGPVVAGIVGVKKFQYDIWGDTVNTASRMESSGEVGKVNISEATYKLLKDDASFTFTSRGKIEAKGKGEMEMYFVSRKS